MANYWVFTQKSAQQKGHRVLKNAPSFQNSSMEHCGFTGYTAAPSAQVCLRPSIPLTRRPIKLLPPTQPYETNPATLHEMDAELLSSAGSASVQNHVWKSGDVQGREGEKTLEKRRGTYATHSGTRGAALLNKSASGSRSRWRATKNNIHGCNQTHTYTRRFSRVRNTNTQRSCI